MNDKTILLHGIIELVLNLIIWRRTVCDVVLKISVMKILLEVFLESFINNDGCNVLFQSHRVSQTHQTGLCDLEISVLTPSFGPIH